MNRFASSAVSSRTSLLIVSYNLSSGGVEEVIRGYVAHLDKAKYRVIVAYVQGGAVSAEIEGRKDVRVVCLAPGGRVARFRKLWRVAREEHVQIVHNHFGWYGLVVGLLVGAARVETMHNVYDWFTGPKRIGYACYCLLASRIIAVSDFVASGNIRYFRIVRKSRVSTVHNGIDIQRFENAPRERQLRDSMGIDESDVVIGFVGRLEDQKGLPFLLKAAERLNRDFKGLKFMLVGSGSREESLKAEATALGIRNIIFAGFESDVSRYLKAFDVFVLPSLFEGLPISLLEAMASRLPVVASRVGGVPEAVVENVTGFLVEPGDADQLVRRLSELVLRSDLRSAMGEKGLLRVKQEFSVASMISKTEQIYAQLLRR